MQIHALDSTGTLIHAHQALRQTDYYCLECQELVRLRSGPQRRSHFYHLEPTRFCRQHQKGPVHLQLQSHFLRELPAADCQLELPFPDIRRIADVAWLSQKIIFEIQCSPISAQEVLARNRDYQQEGWSVIWILHDQRYNKRRLSAAEIALCSSPHFFSNMNSQGEGIIYDQFAIYEKGFRQERLPPLPICLRKPPQAYSFETSSYPLRLLKQRSIHWKYFLSGDLTSLFLQTPTSPYLQQAVEKENRFYSSHIPLTWNTLPLHFWQKVIVKPYQITFRFLLEKMCR